MHGSELSPDNQSWVLCIFLPPAESRGQRSQVLSEHPARPRVAVVAWRRGTWVCGRTSFHLASMSSDH